MDWYERWFVKELLRVLGDKQLMITDLIQLANKPPALRISTKVFLRRYPDKFYLETSLISNQTSVKKNTDGSLPMFI